jgi:chemotaxis protein methyltransferase CheR
MTAAHISAEEYEEFCRYLEEASGIVLGDNKQPLLGCRLDRLMREFGIGDFASLLEQLHSRRNSVLHEHVVDAMTTHETLWFRDAYPFEILKHELLPQLATPPATPLRIWSAACSSGQEAYSISMTIEEYLDSNPGALPGRVEVEGTDISTCMLRAATDAVYDDNSLSHGISAQRRQRFFTPLSDQWQLRPEVTDRTRFHKFNLLSEFGALGKFDIIFCRNVLIYFSREIKSDILTRMARSLNPGGYLFLGSAESPAGLTDAFETVHSPRGVVYRLRAAARQDPPPSSRD